MENKGGNKIDDLIVELNLNGTVEEVLEQLKAVPDEQLPDLVQALAGLADKVDQIGSEVLRRAINVAAKRAIKKIEDDRLINGPVVGNA